MAEKQQAPVNHLNVLSSRQIAAKRAHAPAMQTATVTNAVAENVIALTDTTQVGKHANFGC